jgi:hypothetical protein
MTFSIWLLVLAAFLAGGVSGVFVMVVIGIHIGDRTRRLADTPDAPLGALTRSMLGVGVRADNLTGEEK